MSTNATISIENVDNSIDSIYLHWDGDSAGAILKEHYVNPEKVLQLIKLGDVSSLGPEIGTKHSFDSRDANVTTFYGRDRGDRNVRAEHYVTKAQFIAQDCNQQYNYLFTNGEWKVSKYSGNLTAL